MTLFSSNEVQVGTPSFFCRKLTCGNVDCSYCKIFYFSIQQHCDIFPYSCSIISFFQDFLSFVNCCYFIITATYVVVTIAVGTPLSTLVYLEQFALPARLVSSRFLICQQISDYLLSQSLYQFWKCPFLPGSGQSWLQFVESDLYVSIYLIQFTHGFQSLYVGQEINMLILLRVKRILYCFCQIDLKYCFYY